MRTVTQAHSHAGAQSCKRIDAQAYRCAFTHVDTHRGAGAVMEVHSRIVKKAHSDVGALWRRCTVAQAHSDAGAQWLRRTVARRPTVTQARSGSGAQ